MITPIDRLYFQINQLNILFMFFSIVDNTIVSHNSTCYQLYPFHFSYGILLFISLHHLNFNFYILIYMHQVHN